MSTIALSSAHAAAEPDQTFIEIKTWRLHNSPEDQAKRVSDFLEHGLFPASTRAGAKPVGAFANLIGPDGPYLVSMTQYRSLAAMQDVLVKLAADEAYEKASRQLGDGPGMRSSVLKAAF